MSIAVLRRRGTTAENAAFTGAAGEFTWETDGHVIRGHDGSTVGGFRMVSETATQTLTNKTADGLVLTGATTLPGSGSISSGGNLTVGTGVIGTAGTTTLSLRVGSTEQVQIPTTAAAVNRIQMSGGATGTGPYIAATSSTDTNVRLRLFSQGTEGIYLHTNLATEQVRVTHTASANRVISLTGSNGGNPAISVTGGSLSLSSATVAASGFTVTGGAFSLNGATNAVSAAVATASTNKVAVDIGGTTYYLLMTTVP